MTKTIRLALLILLVSACGVGHYSDGYRQGTLIKFSHKGFLNKSWEGQLSLGTMVNAGKGGMAPAVWEFTLRNDPSGYALVGKLDSAMSSEKVVRIYYTQAYLGNYWTNESDYYADSVRVLP